MDKRILAKLEALNPCFDEQEWEWIRNQPSAQQAWDSCPRGKEMLWLLAQTDTCNTLRKRIVLATCECVRLVLPFVRKDEKRPLQAIETVEAWAYGKASIKDVRKAKRAAYAAAYANGGGNPSYAAYAACLAANVEEHPYIAAAYAAAYSTDYDAYMTAAEAQAAAAADRSRVLQQCADIVRKYFPNPPRL